MKLFNLALIMAPLLLAGCDQQQTAEKETPTPVKVMTVSPRQSPFIHRFPARIIASTSTQLSFKHTGVITLADLREGAPVRKGTPLAWLDPKDVKHRIADRESAYRTAQRQYDRYAELGKRQVISQAELDIQRTQRDAAWAAYNLAREELQDMTIYAPYSGVISKINVQNHHLISSGQAIMTMENTDNIDAVFNISESMYEALRLPQPDLLFNVEFSVLPGKKFVASYKEHSVNNAMGSMTWQVTLTLPRPAALSLVSGISGTVTIEPLLPTIQEIITPVLVPISAIIHPDHQSDGHGAVWVLTHKSGHDYVALRHVTLGTLATENIEIKQGLLPGETIVVAGANALKANQQVYIWQRESGL